MTIMAELSAKVDITKSWSGRDWHSLQTGSPYFCFRIARGRRDEESLQWSLYDLSSASVSVWLIFHLASLLDSTKIAQSPIATEKRNTSWHFGKKSENYCLKAKPWMRTSFLNFPYVIKAKKMTLAGYKREWKKKQSRLLN